MGYHADVRLTLPVVAWTAWLAATGYAIDRDLDAADLSEAVALGQTALESRRTGFHGRYRLPVAGPPLDYIEIVTPFRRVVLAAEARLRAGERLFGQREALEVLGDDPNAVDLLLELTFHPLNTFVGVPAYAVELVTAGSRVTILPRRLHRIPRFGPRVEGGRGPAVQAGSLTPGPTEPLLGGTIVATFDGGRLQDAGLLEVLVLDEGSVLARGLVDVAALR